MRIRKPSPAMVVAIAALVMAGTGSAIAAVNFAKNAGAVNHLRAVKASSKVKNAAGKLVATSSGGGRPGKFPNKFLADTAKSTTFAFALPVNDNVGGAPVGLGSANIGRLTASCNDQSTKPGIEDPTVTLTLSNPTIGTLNFSRDTGSGNALVGSLAIATANSLAIKGNNTFRFRVQQNATQLVFDGFVRQDGSGTAAATCVIAGTTELVAP
jgi:hypothetical protein